MGRVRQQGTAPELLVRAVLRSLGVSYRLNARGLPGSPDLVNRSRGFAIFVHGCYWHRHAGCRLTTTPTRNAAFWRDKFDANVIRDRRAIDALRQEGLSVFVVWECETRDPMRLTHLVRAFILSLGVPRKPDRVRRSH